MSLIDDMITSTMIHNHDVLQKLIERDHFYNEIALLSWIGVGLIAIGLGIRAWRKQKKIDTITERSSE